MPNPARFNHHLYYKFRKLMTSLWSALPHIPEMKKIIMALELEPIDMNWKLWTDYNGNKLIYNNHKIKITRISEKSQTRDLYKKSPPSQLQKKFKLVIFTINNNIITLWSLCLDNKIRCLQFSNNSWSPNIPPLSLPFSPLTLLFKYRKLQNYKCISPYHISPWPPVDNNIYINQLKDSLNANR